MVAASFARDLDVMALGASGVVSLQTAAVFAQRFQRARVPMHLTGCCAGLFGLAYCLFRLCYWYLGASSALPCNTVLVLGGVLQNLSVAVALVHLLLRAEAVNSKSRLLGGHWRAWRCVAIGVTVLNLLSFAVYLALRSTAVVHDAFGTARCAFVLDGTALQLKYIAQALNHVLQTGLFVYPLLLHVRHMNDSIQGGQEWHFPGLKLYRDMAVRAVAAMLCSTTFTVAVAVLVLFYQQSLCVRRVVVSLSIMDMGLTLASITYAIDARMSGTDQQQQQQHKRRSSFSSLQQQQQQQQQRRSTYSVSPVNTTNAPPTSAIVVEV